MSTQVPIGQLAEDTAERDAIHIAIEPVVAEMKLYPGQDVGIGGPDRKASQQHPHIGIVDPFLSHPVEPESRFFLFLYPNTVTEMRHHWSLPVLDDPAPTKDESLRWMEEFAEKHYSHNDEYYDGFGRNYTADEVIKFATEFLRDGDRHVQQGSESVRDYKFPQEFWKHYEAVTGTTVSDAAKDRMPFCCTC